MTYPEFNWWSGCARAYESRLSIFLRFCEFNHLSVRRAQDVLEFHPHRPLSPSETEIDRLATLLGESFLTIRTAFYPDVSLSRCGSYSLSSSGRDERVIRFCPECAKLGYHSTFHEVAWLAMCPFHGVALQVAHPPRHYGTILESYVRALQYVMKMHCSSWPRAQRGPAEGGLGRVPENILDWAARATKSSAEFSDKDICVLNSHEFSRELFDIQKLGQIYAIEPVPDEMKMYLVPIVGKFNIECLEFARISDYFYNTTGGRRAISILFDFYVKTQPLSYNPPPYVGYFKNLVEMLRNKHVTCHCNWLGVVLTTGEVLWRKVIDGGGRSDNERCPYEIVLGELEARWGRWTEVWPNRLADLEFGRLIALSQSVRDFGFVRLASDGAVRSEEYSHYLCSPFENYTWILAPSELDLLNAAAKWQIEAEFSAMMGWLDQISSDRKPSEYEHPAGLVRIQSHRNKIVLMRWTRDVDASSP